MSYCFHVQVVMAMGMPRLCLAWKSRHQPQTRSQQRMGTCMQSRMKRMKLHLSPWL